MARWNDEPREESWPRAIAQWAAFLLVGAALFVAITAVDVDAAPPGRVEVTRPTPRPTPIVVGLPVEATPTVSDLLPDTDTD